MRFLFLLLLLSACSNGLKRESIKESMALNEFIRHEITASPFLLTSYQRVNVIGGAANIYVEGDGRAWVNKRRASLDPTPKNPVALKLAQLDDAGNVIYLARPCQYSKTTDSSPCDPKYWTSHRFAPEVIGAMNTALDNIKQRHQITGFNLIGFSGGGNVVALLAKRRNDVLSLRTVAGNLDHTTYNSMHKVSQMPASLNAKGIAKNISHIPQIHFIGGQDKIVPKEVYESYKASSGDTNCVKSYVVDKATHIKGWESVWNWLLNQPVDCDKR